MSEYVGADTTAPLPAILRAPPVSPFIGQALDPRLRRLRQGCALEVLAAFLAVAIPGSFAALFGWFIFRSRVKGVYFSIITQALAWAAYLSFSNNRMLMGGTNGLTNFYKPLNTVDPQHPKLAWIYGLY